MEKSILMSIQPQWTCKILNGEKTIEVRKKFPKDYVGWVYIYCTKKCNITQDNNGEYVSEYDKNYRINSRFSIHGKVVARFWCDNVARITNFPSGYETYISGTFPNIKVMKEEELLKLSCLTGKELRNYLPCGKERTGYAIHISKLEVFDKPKELKEFYKAGAWKVFEEQFDSSYLKRKQQEIMEELEQTITRAPQSFQFIEGE